MHDQLLDSTLFPVNDTDIFYHVLQNSLDYFFSTQYFMSHTKNIYQYAI